MPHEGHPGHEGYSDTDTSGQLNDDRIDLVSVGIDIGSSTSHLAFSRLRLERRDAFYSVTGREVIHESPIFFTPYLDGELIDVDTLDQFIRRSYVEAGLGRDDIDTGALILTGTAVRRRNARAIGELFAAESGKFVAVSAGDALEATLAAHGSGAVASSKDGRTVLNIDIGGGTTKFALCRNGRIEQVGAVEGGARLIATDEAGRVVRLEPFGKVYARDAGLTIEQGDLIAPDQARAVADQIAARIVEAAGLVPLSRETEPRLRLPPMPAFDATARLMFSGGVSEYLYAEEAGSFGDLGPALARCLRRRLGSLSPSVERPRAKIRATVVGASQYTVQLSGATIFVTPPDALPLGNLPIVAPSIDLTSEVVDANKVALRIREARRRQSLENGEAAMALAVAWKGSATFRRLQDFCEGVIAAMSDTLAAGRPLVLVNQGDVGRLIGMHLKDEMAIETAVVSIDGVKLDELDFIDIGRPIGSGAAVPVVVKSLVFPAAEDDR